jgi:predicted ATPase
MIYRIKIKNFRSLDVDVALDSVTVLIGRSGAGKTNFVDALRFLRLFLQCQTHQQVQVQFENVHPVTSMQPLPLEYEIIFGVEQLQKEKFTYAIKMIPHQGGASGFGITEEKLTFGNTTLFHKAKDKWIDPPSVQKATSFSHHGVASIATIKGDQKISIAYIALTTGIGCYDFPSYVCRDMVGGSSYNSETGLAGAGENVNEIFDGMAQDLTRLASWDRINEAIRVMNDSIETIDQTERKGNISVTHRIGDAVIALPMRNESEGVRRFFTHLLAFHQKPPKQIMVFEEPEKGIYPAGFAALAGEMKNCYSCGQGQVVLTTHSPEMLDLFEPENVRVVEMQDGITRIGSISEYQMEALRENLLYPRELLTVEDARLDAPAVPASAKEVQCV